MGLRVAVTFAFGLLLPTWSEADEPPRTIYLSHDAGAEPTPLIRHDEFTVMGSPDWSPDGKKIAFDGWKGARGESNQDSRVLVTTFNGADFRDLGDGAMPSWSADGAKLVFSRYSPNNGVWLMNADGSEKQLLDGRGWSGQWSPDGKTIAYTTYGGSRPDICLYDVATKEKRYVFNEAGPAYGMINWNFCWSPDSKRLCFKASSGNEFEVATVSVDGPASHLHTHYRGVECESDLSWHPDGRRIVFAIPSPVHGGRFRLFSFPADGSAEPAPLPGLPDEYGASNPDFSPDGRLLLFGGHRASAL